MSVKTKTKTNNSQIRLVRTAELDQVIGNMRFYFPIMDDNEILKMLISKGSLVAQNEIQNSSPISPKKGLMTQVLDAKKRNKLFITDLNQQEPQPLKP